MTERSIRFAIDESRVKCEPAQLAATVRALVLLIDDCRHEDEDIARTSELYATEICGGINLVDLLYSPEGAPFLNPDLRGALRLIVDRCVELESVYAPSDRSSKVGSQDCTSMSVAFAHDAQGKAQAVGVLCVAQPIPPAGAKEVTVVRAGVEKQLHWIASRESLSKFLRAIPDIELFGPEAYMTHAARAFPDVVFVPGLASQASRFSRPFDAIRTVLTNHLGAINDHFGEIFVSESGQPALVTKRFAASCGIEASPESPKTHGNKKAMKERDVTVDGVTLCCEWHTKFEPDRDRVHFHPGSPRVAAGRIVVGIFAEHLTT